MKQSIWGAALLLVILPWGLQAQYNQKPDAFDKVNNAVNKAVTAIAVFQPYLLKARQLFYDAKQMGADFKRDARQTFGKDSGRNNNNGYNNGGAYSNNNGNGYNSNGNSSNNSYGNSGTSGNNSYGNGGSSYGNNNNSYGSNNNQSTYLQGQSLPINNPQSVNNDGTGNWGNQNNGLYGNCLDALTGTVLGMGEAASSPGSVDLLFFAPADGQNTYVLMTPGFARNNSTAGYMTEHVSEQVLKWSDVNESEVALTKITIGQFNQIQNNGQIQNAARNAQEYGGYYTSVGQKLDGAVFAIKTETAGREVYALVAILKQYGTSGNNGYLKIAIKSTGVDTNRDGQADANAYVRGN